MSIKRIRVLLMMLVTVMVVNMAVAAQDTPYQAEEVSFQNGDVTLAGTLTLPQGEGPFAALVLVSGSGPQDRDESTPGLEIKPFLLLADHLTRQGYAVLRYDDRGVGGSSGDWANSTIQDFAADATTAIEYLKTRSEIDAESIGILGHSEGGSIAAMLGASNPDVTFIITLAGMVVNARDLLLRQNELMLRAEGASQEVIDIQLEAMPRAFDAVDAEDAEAFEAILRQSAADQYAAMTAEEQAAVGSAEDYADLAMQNLSTYFTPWFRSLLNYDWLTDWSQVTVPVLAIFGGLDTQVEAEQNAPALEAALTEAGNSNFTIITLADANHMFQQAQTGAVSEYATLAPEFTPELLPTITEWLATNVNPAAAQNTAQSGSSSAADGMIAYVLQDEFLVTYGLRLIDTNGTLIADILLDETAPQNYLTACDGPPQWSPDGRYLAFVRETAERTDDVRQLMVYEVESGEARVVSDNFYRTFDWSPDSQFIVHDTPIERNDAGQAINVQGLYRVNVETGVDEPMIPSVEGAPLWRPDWSPDGAHVGFHTPQQMEGIGDFVLADVDGMTGAVWTEPVVGSYDWSPDGTQIVFDSVTYVPQSSELAIGEVDDANMPQNVQVIVADGVPNIPRWSLDGSLIAYKQTDPDELRASLWVVAPDGSNPQQIAPEDIHSFAWSPDSTALVAANEAGIHIFSLNGDAPRTIAAGGCPAWRP